MTGRDFNEQDMLRVLRRARNSHRFDRSSLRFDRPVLDRLRDPAEIDRIVLDLMPPHVSPSGRWRLPIDDGIDFLIETGRAKIGVDRLYYGEEGPYVFAREFIQIWLREFEKFDAARNDNISDAIFYLTERLGEARENVWFLTQVDWGRFVGPKALPPPLANPWNAGDMAQVGLDNKRWKAINGYMEDLNRAFAATVRLQDLLESRLETMPQRTGPGRKASEVRRALVRHVARLFELLTGNFPASHPDSPFADFLESVWNSMGDDVPVVSFQRTIAEVCGQKNNASS